MPYPNGRIPPVALTPIPARFHTHGTTAYLRADAADAFLRVAAEFEQAFGKTLVCMSFYRPIEDQVRIFLRNYKPVNRGRSKKTDRSYQGRTYAKRVGKSPVASPGYSNHGLGVTVDFNAGVQRLGREHTWMLEHGSRHGWDWTEGRRIGEPWHWTYVPSKDRGKGAPRATAAAPSGDTRTMQRNLDDLGYPLKVDGKTGPATRAAITAFQKDFDLKPDGIAGPATRKALAAAMSKLDNMQKQINDIHRLTTRYLDGKVSHAGRYVLDEPITLRGGKYDGKRSTVRTKFEWMDVERDTQTNALVKAVKDGIEVLAARFTKGA